MLKLRFTPLHILSLFLRLMQASLILACVGLRFVCSSAHERTPPVFHHLGSVSVPVLVSWPPLCLTPETLPLQRTETTARPSATLTKFQISHVLLSFFFFFLTFTSCLALFRSHPPPNASRHCPLSLPTQFLCSNRKPDQKEQQPVPMQEWSRKLSPVQQGSEVEIGGGEKVPARKTGLTHNSPCINVYMSH